MSPAIRAASAAECIALWPAVSADHLFPTGDAFRQYRDAAPWQVRVTERGEACVLGRWKRHLDVLAIRGIWAAERDRAEFVRDALAQAAEHEFGRVLSPLLPEMFLDPYYACGMRVAQRIVAIQGHPELVLPADPPPGIRIRQGTAADIDSITRIDRVSFNEFWRWQKEDLRALIALERLGVAEANGGAIIGYTLATVSRGAATLSRLATVPHARRSGIGRALLAESARWAVWQGAVTFSLCTQEDNLASRALYAQAGLTEIPERYAFAIGDVKEA
jgi:[ribosomal protein S18]-alanine N-acetyltransferase